MPSFDQHVTQAISNVAFVRYLAESPDGFADWSITGCFYSAVHFAEAVIHRESPISCRFSDNSVVSSRDVIHSSDPKSIDFANNRPQKSAHWYRKQIISLNDDYFGSYFEDAYKNLYELSHQSRYDCYEGCADDMALAKEALDEIIQHMRDRYQVPI